MTPSRSYRPDEFDVAGAAHPGDMCAECSGKLDSERPHASRRAVDQDALARFDASGVTQGDQGGAGRHRHRSSLLERQVRRHRCQPIRVDAHIFREATLLQHRENGITGTELRDLGADLRYLTGHVCAQDAHLGLAKPQGARHQAGDVRLASHVVPVVRLDGRCAYSYQYLAGSWRRCFDVGEFEVFW
jgi:hypothetical protein